MADLSTADQSVSPPVVSIPRRYNAAADLIGRNLQAGRGAHVAFIDDNGSYTYQDVDQRSGAFANLLQQLEVQAEQRILLCLHDSIDFPTAFLGAIKAGVIPVAVNTLLTQGDYEYMLTDSAAQIAVVSEALLPLFEPLLKKVPYLKRILVASTTDGPNNLATLLSTVSNQFQVADTSCDAPCFWLYSSGSTGAPKGTVHVHSSLILTAELYASPVLHINERDVVFSAAKLFFAYGLGNALTFPMSVGATAVLMAERPTPASVSLRLKHHQVTLFCGVPTLYAFMLASHELPAREQLALRCCISAGEALPEEISRRWAQQIGLDILDGIGSTEMLHIFLSNRIGAARYGTTGKPVPGYQLRLVDEAGNPVTQGEVGELHIAGPTSASAYWNNREKTRHTFLGDWTRSGDKYRQDADGYYIYAGRSDDMLKVSGIYVSPIEVESALINHPAILEAAVIGREDDDRLIKPMAYIVLKPDVIASAELEQEIKAFIKACLAPYKYPRWMKFVTELPKTATGKIQRFKLRANCHEPEAEQ